MESSGTADSETIYETAPDTRQRILRVSTELFGVHGFHETSLREIAERVGVSKPAVLYHFPGKADILGALVEPMLRELAEALARAAAASGAPDGSGASSGPSERARWAAIEGVLDVWLEHRHLLRLNFQDMALATTGPVFAQLRDAMLRANFLVAGPNPGFAERVRASQAVAMLSDPVVLFADAPVPALREAVLDGVRRLLDGPQGPTAPHGPDGPARPAPGGRRGRPAAMSPAMIEAARRMHAAGSGGTAIAAALGVSRATVYRHLPQEEDTE
ncbi:TetR family transcriptional regulator [Streptomyces sp. NBC_00193]|uniref:TetR family transcriptional regulator n=1 Tax=unclassified Streptomyces TaxID=2593676 RepID=UPI00224D799C|nr:MULTISPECIES: TetR family transcriptional regulator [unclassified Streptomyces]MCX5127496.1 TetR family transcriptional regulator [Streptomyces sp. NBC_00347]MCX5295083.1 TetR family transcriptional regulator [Streptomyces sp. NBC_00193]